MTDIIDETAINIFTDGSSYTRPRRGGVGMVFVNVNEDGDPVEHEYCPSEGGDNDFDAGVQQL